MSLTRSFFPFYHRDNLTVFKKLPTLCRMEEEGMCSFVDAVWERVVGSRSNRTNCHPFNIWVLPKWYMWLIKLIEWYGDIHKLRLQIFGIFDPLPPPVCMWFALTIPPTLLGLQPLPPPLWQERDPYTSWVFYMKRAFEPESVSLSKNSDIPV